MGSRALILQCSSGICFKRKAAIVMRWGHVGLNTFFSAKIAVLSGPPDNRTGRMWEG
jgi:hypothetical protein